MAGLLDALLLNESGGRNIANTTEGTDSGQAQGYFQITTGTWNDFGGSKYAATPMDASYEQQAEIASKIPLKRWAPSTIEKMRATGKPVDVNKTLGENLTASGESINAGRSPNAGSVAPGAATGATSTGSAPAGTTLTTPTGAVAPYTLGVTPPAPTSAPAIIINQPSPFSDPIADANPWSSLGGAMASAVDPNKAQFLSGGVDGGATPPPPEFESALPATGAAPDIAPIAPEALGEGGISPLGGAFRIAENIGKAATPKLDRYGRPTAPVFAFG